MKLPVAHGSARAASAPPDDVPHLAGREYQIVGAVLLVALAIRLPGLFGDGLWRDQANVYVQLTSPNFGEFFRRVTATEWHPPLFFLVMYLWAKIAGTGEFSLMVLPFTFSMLTVAAVYRLGKAVSSAGAGVIAALLYAVAPLAVQYSSEYLYPFMSFLSTILALLVVRARRSRVSAARSATVVLVTLLVVATHYVGLIYVTLLVAWALTNEGFPHQRACLVAALVLGATPFLFWIPIFLTQRRIGVPYSWAATAPEKLLFFVRTCAEFLPVRPLSFALLFFALLVAGLAVLARARAVERDALALAFIFLAVLFVITTQNILGNRYVLPYYGLLCVFFGSVLLRCGRLIWSAGPAAARPWAVCAVGCLTLALVVGDAANAIARGQTPKSGIRTIIFQPAFDAATLYVIAPDYLASTFAFYSHRSGAVFAGFVRWNQPEVFRLADYAADWNKTDAIDVTVRAIANAAAGRRYRALDVVVDDSARNEGRVPYGRVAELLRRLDERYRLLSRTRHPGRDEPVSEYRYALSRL